VVQEILYKLIPHILPGLEHMEEIPYAESTKYVESHPQNSIFGSHNQPFGGTAFLKYI